MKLVQRTTVLAAIGWLLLATNAVADDTFRDQIAPLLERRCVTCHNDQQREGDFSLQSAESAFEAGYIEANDADSSHLIELITPVEGKAEMPKGAAPLTADEVQLIRNWIDAGAEWPANQKLEVAQVKDFDWWSFRPVAKPKAPAIQHPWIRSPIDAFVLRRLNERGLSPSPEADRRTLIRRLTFDLTGLPPTPDEVAAFVNDPAPDAYEQLVERLLASKHYGERWARHWLDVVKYADTCGYDKDKLRPNAWPYRDYVIRSFNDSKSYSRFIREQIAGDVLFPDDPEGVIGLGFIAAGPWDFIGHVEVPESKIDGKVARNLDRDDMVTNTINTFCSVTIQCARCHHHKFDPFTQEHYYGLQAVFAAVDRAERKFDTEPAIAKKRSHLRTLVAENKTGLDDLDREIKKAAGPRLAELNDKIAKLKTQTRLTKDPAFGYHSGITDKADSNKWVEIALAQPTDLARVVLHPCHDDFAGIGAGFGFPRRFLVEATAEATGNENWIPLADHRERVVSNPGLKPFAIPCNVKSIRRIRITATELAERQNDFIFALAEVRLFNETHPATNLALGATVTSLDSIEAPVRWSRNYLVDGKWAIQGTPAKDRTLAALNRERRELLRKAETVERRQRRVLYTTAIKMHQAELDSLPDQKTVYAAATHFSAQGNFKPTRGTPRPIHTLMRGDVMRPGSPVPPGVLPFNESQPWKFGQDEKQAQDLSESDRRAKLAQWLTSKEHPLVWRSIVNRVWQYHFGIGIVATPNDFGRMGAEPTHPELLDWLACEFRDGDQSFKSLHRLIVNSSVYRQASHHDPKNAKIDSGNKFLWRMNRRRLEAEEIRDSILAVSGALDRKMGGPGFFLFKLEHPEHSPHYEYHKFDPSDPASHRRSIYRFIVRSQPNPWMTVLDCADSSQSTPRRNETLTSLQALTMLNNRFNLEMANRMSERLERDASSLGERIEMAMQLIAQRNPSVEELESMTTYAKKHGLNNLCRLLFNLSEFVFLD